MAPVVAAAIIGAGASLAGTAASLYGASKEREDAKKAKQNANRQITGWEQKADQILRESESNATRLSSAGDVSKYRELRDSYNPSRYVVDAQPFDKSGYSVEDYLNPNREAIMADIRKQATSTAAGAGLGHSSGALEAYIEAALAKDEDLYKEARAEMKDELSFDYGLYTDYINQQQKRLDSMQQGYLAQMNSLRNDITFDQQQTDAMTQNRLSLGNSIANSRAQLV